MQLFQSTVTLKGLSKDQLRDQIEQPTTRKNLSTKQATLLISAVENSYSAIGHNDMRCKHFKQFAKRIHELRDQKRNH